MKSTKYLPYWKKLFAKHSISAHCLKVYQDRFGYVDSTLPVSYGLHKQGLALPVYGDMTTDDIKQVLYTLRRFLDED